MAASKSIGLIGYLSAFVLFLFLLPNLNIGLCPFYARTGLLCPGCGSLRSIEALVGGDLRSSLEYHILLLPTLLFSLLILLIRGSKPYSTFVEWSFTNYFRFTVLLLFLLFWVLRNISWPQLDFLRP